MPVFTYGDGQALAYAEYGPPGGFPVLIQHGLIASIKGGALFHRLAERGARLICPARPGYGDSTPYELRSYGDWGRVVAGLAVSLGLGRFDVLGMSSGAPYGYAAGWALPAQVRSIYIFSGMPALYDAGVAAQWPYPLSRGAALPAMQQLARELFFSGLSEADRESDDVIDSMRNDCFGVAQDLRLRAEPWGFTLAEVKAPVFMRHSRLDPDVPFAAAEKTAALLPRCTFQAAEGGVHFSPQALDEFIEQVIAPRFAE